MANLTSAAANKLLKQLQEDKEYLENKEKESCTYTASVNEEPVIPEYNYKETDNEIAKIDKKIAKIKHAINVANTTMFVVLPSTGEQITVDELLVRMAQLNKRKTFLDRLRKNLPKSRVDYGYGTRPKDPEYKYINYDLEEVKRDFQDITEKIMEMQIALDKHNQTVTFEVPID